MFKTFLEEFKKIFKSKWKTVTYLLLLFIPMIYVLITTTAFKEPFHNSDKLRVAVVNLDKKTFSNNLENELKGKHNLELGTQKIDINVQDATAIYDSYNEAKKAVNDGTYDTLIVIPQGYNDSLVGVKKEISNFLNPLFSQTLSQTVQKINNLLNGNRIQFINSYRTNFLAGVMTNMGSSIKDFTYSSLKASQSSLGQVINNALKSILEPFKNNLISHKILGKDINSYGKGLSPFFIAISLWAGALATTFVIKNKRYFKEKSGTFKNYFGKTMVWLLTGWIQGTLLFVALSLNGLLVEGVWKEQWKLWLAIMAISTLFNLVVQAIAYTLRYGDKAKFAIVVLMIINLVASGGTFPAFMQNKFFRAINPYLPFTYAVDLVREVLYHPSTTKVFTDIGILTIYPAVMIPISLTSNYLFDKKTLKVINSTKVYDVFEIDTGDK